MADAAFHPPCRRNNWRFSTQLSKQDKAIALKVAGRVQGLNNGLTNQKGMLEGLVKGGSLAKKQAEEEGTRGVDCRRPGPPEEVRRRASRTARPSGRRREDARTQRRAQHPGQLVHLPRSSRDRSTACRWSVPSPTWNGKPPFSSGIGPGFATVQDRMQRTMDATADRALLRWALGLAAALPAGQRIAPVDQAIGLQAGNAQGGRREERSRLISTGSMPAPGLADRQFRLGLIEKSTAESARHQGLVHPARRGAQPARRKRIVKR